jgi:hypothetical protein
MNTHIVWLFLALLAPARPQPVDSAGKIARRASNADYRL